MPHECRMPKRNSKSQLPSRAKNQYSKFVTTALLKVELNSLSGWDEAQEMQYLMDSAVVESLACQYSVVTAGYLMILQ